MIIRERSRALLDRRIWNPQRPAVLTIGTWREYLNRQASLKPPNLSAIKIRAMYAIAPQQHYLPTSSRHPPPLPLPPRAMNPTTPTTTNTNEGQMNPPPPPGSVFPTPSQAPPSTSAVEGGRIYRRVIHESQVEASIDRTHHAAWPSYSSRCGLECVVSVIR